MEPSGGMLGHATPAKALCLVSVASYGRRTALEAPGQPSQAAHSPAQETTKLQLVYRAEKQSQRTGKDSHLLTHTHVMTFT